MGDYGFVSESYDTLVADVLKEVKRIDFEERKEIGYEDNPEYACFPSQIKATNGESEINFYIDIKSGNIWRVDISNQDMLEGTDYKAIMNYVTSQEKPGELSYPHSIMTVPFSDRKNETFQIGFEPGSSGYKTDVYSGATRNPNNSRSHHKEQYHNHSTQAVKDSNAILADMMSSAELPIVGRPADNDSDFVGVFDYAKSAFPGQFSYVMRSYGDCDPVTDGQLSIAHRVDSNGETADTFNYQSTSKSSRKSLTEDTISQRLAELDNLGIPLGGEFTFKEI